MPSMPRSFYPFVIACSLAGAVPITHAQGAGLASLSWLAGCWGRETAEAGSVEHWMPPAAGTMFGVGRTVKAGKTVEYEFMRILEAPDGKLLYVALPSGQKEATFTQLRLSDTEVVFENPAHDFPQRIIYRLEGGTRLLASIEGMRKGTLRKVEFPMKRTSCDAEATGPSK